MTNQPEGQTEKWIILYNTSYNTQLKLYPNLFDSYEDAEKLPLATGLNRVLIKKITLDKLC